jgi:hypothetical protein
MRIKQNLETQGASHVMCVLLGNLETQGASHVMCVLLGNSLPKYVGCIRGLFYSCYLGSLLLLDCTCFVSFSLQPLFQAVLDSINI